MTANDSQSFVVRRSGSQKRRRRRHIDVCCDDAEFVIIDDKARTAGMSLASYLRTCAIGYPGPRARRSPSIEIEALAKATAALNKVASNVNQIARVLNSGGSVGLGHAAFATLTEIRAAVIQILDAVGRRDRS